MHTFFQTGTTARESSFLIGVSAFAIGLRVLSQQIQLDARIIVVEAQHGAHFVQCLKGFPQKKPATSAIRFQQRMVHFRRLVRCASILTRRAAFQQVLTIKEWVDVSPQFA